MRLTVVDTDLEEFQRLDRELCSFAARIVGDSSWSVHVQPICSASAHEYHQTLMTLCMGPDSFHPSAMQSTVVA